MATEYRFLGTNVDVLLVTDAPTNAKTFTVTDLISEDPVDIINGIDIGIEEYHEADFVQMAMDVSVALYRIDALGEACLVLPGVVAGQFNGTSSFLSVPGIDFTEGSGEIANDISAKVTFRVNQENIANLPEQFYLMQSSNSANVLSLRFIRVTPDDGNEFFTAFVLPTLNGATWSAGPNKSGFVIRVNANMCYTLEVQTLRSGTDVTWTYVLNEEMQTVNSIIPQVVAATPTIVYFGASGGQMGAEDFFPGIMRDLSVSIDGTEVINIPDPSTGANSGTGADGTPTDITQVTVIV